MRATPRARQTPTSGPEDQAVNFVPWPAADRGARYQPSIRLAPTGAALEARHPARGRWQRARRVCRDREGRACVLIPDNARTSSAALLSRARLVVARRPARRRRAWRRGDTVRGWIRNAIVDPRGLRLDLAISWASRAFLVLPDSRAAPASRGRAPTIRSQRHITLPASGSVEYRLGHASISLTLRPEARRKCSPSGFVVDSEASRRD